MSDKERLGAALAIALFLHFAITLFHPTQQEFPTFSVVINMEDSPVAADHTSGGGTGIQSQSAKKTDDKADKKRQAYLRYLDEVDAAIHARRLTGSESELIGFAVCAFTIRPDGFFTAERILTSSGNPGLDASALTAIRRASGVVRRPEIIGQEPINVSLPIKYQYDLQ